LLDIYKLTWQTENQFLIATNLREPSCGTGKLRAGQKRQINVSSNENNWHFESETSLTVSGGSCCCIILSFEETRRNMSKGDSNNMSKSR